MIPGGMPRPGMGAYPGAQPGAPGYPAPQGGPGFPGARPAMPGFASPAGVGGQPTPGFPGPRPLLGVPGGPSASPAAMPSAGMPRPVVGGPSYSAVPSTAPAVPGLGAMNPSLPSSFAGPAPGQFNGPAPSFSAPRPFPGVTPGGGGPFPSSAPTGPYNSGPAIPTGPDGYPPRGPQPSGPAGVPARGPASMVPRPSFTGPAQPSFPGPSMSIPAPSGPVGGVMGPRPGTLPTAGPRPGVGGPGFISPSTIPPSTGPIGYPGGPAGQPAQAHVHGGPAGTFAGGPGGPTVGGPSFNAPPSGTFVPGRPSSGPAFSGPPSSFATGPPTTSGHASGPPLGPPQVNGPPQANGPPTGLGAPATFVPPGSRGTPAFPGQPSGPRPGLGFEDPRAGPQFHGMQPQAGVPNAFSSPPGSMQGGSGPMMGGPMMGGLGPMQGGPGSMMGGPMMGGPGMQGGPGPMMGGGGPMMGGGAPAPVAEVNEQYQCRPAYMALTVGAMPANAGMVKRAALPFGLCVHPLAEREGSLGQNGIPIVNFGSAGVVRCKPCRAYVNPFVKFSDGGRRWKCNFCGFLNDVPPTYAGQIDTEGHRLDAAHHPELSQGSVEMIAPAEYMVRPPQPPVYMFVIDVSYNSVATGMLHTACQTILSVRGYSQ
jgi:protein transport protein SEC24